MKISSRMAIANVAQQAHIYSVPFLQHSNPFPGAECGAECRQTG
jgi:hypothetical protein